MKKVNIAIAVLIILTFTVPVFAQDKDDDHHLWSASTYIQSAKIHYKHVYQAQGKLRNDLYHCIDLLKEGASRFPNKPEFYYYLGTFYAEINAIDTVVAYFDTVVAMCDDESIDKKDRKNCYKGDKWIDKMDKLRQDYWERSYNGAIEFMNQYDAAKDMAAAEGLAEDSVHVLDSLATLAFETAMEDFKNADLAKPNDPRTIESIGVLLQRENRNLEAIDYYKKVMNLKGGEQKADAEILGKIAYAYIYIPDWEKAIEWFEKLIVVTPEDVNALINLFVAYSNINNTDKALEYNDRVLILQPDNTQFLFNAGQHWFVKMQEYADSLSRIKDDMPDAKTKRAYFEGKANECMEKASGYFERIAEIDPTDVDALRQLGILNLLGQNPQGAIDALEKFIAVNPNDNDVLDFLGRAYIMSGDSKAAIKPYEMIVDNDPGRGDIWERLGDLYEYNQMMDKSKAARAKAEEINKL
ncbi:MAG: tetratricopeptide repeat protein [Candidatus Zixiibacteriota bacterium]